MQIGKNLENTGSVLEFLKVLVSIPSVNPDLCDGRYSEVEIIAELKRWAESLGMQCELQPVDGDRANLIVTVPGIDQARSVIFESHTDTVSVTQMNIDPYCATEKDGLLYGRGSCDTKASVASMAWAIKHLHEAAESPPITVHWVAAVDEEYSMKGAIALASWITDRMSAGEEVLGVIIGEPTELRPVVAHKGAIHFPVVAKGEPAHGSTPHLGKNSVVMMSEVIQRLVKDYIPKLASITHPLTGSATLNIGKIVGGTQANIVPAECRLLLDRRTVPGEINSDVFAEIVELLQSVESVEGCTLDFSEEHNSCEPVNTDPECVLARALRTSLEQAGKDGTPVGVPYATDGSRMTGCGVPLIVFGPGDIAQAHTKNEFVELSQVEEAVCILQEIPLLCSRA